MSAHEQLVAHRAATLGDIRNQIAVLKAMEGEAVAQFREAIGDARGDIEVNGKLVAKVSYVNRFDPELAADVLPEYGIDPDLVSETIITSSKAREILPPSVYRQCQAPSLTPTIKVVSE